MSTFHAAASIADSSGLAPAGVGASRDGSDPARRTVARGLWTRPRRSLLRRVHRCVAVVVALCLALFQLEALIADVCDGDATPAELAALVGPASDLPRDAVQVAVARAAAIATHAAPDVVASQGEAGGVGSPVSRPAHTCHCVHAHGGVLPRLDPVEVHVVDVATVPPIGRPLAASDVARAPLSRPPLA
jgi:hypothetical protein